MVTDQYLVTDAANYFVEITVPDHFAKNHTAADTTVSFINWAVVGIHCVEAAINQTVVHLVDRFACQANSD